MSRLLAEYGRPMMPKIPMKSIQVQTESLSVAPKGTYYVIEVKTSQIDTDKAVAALKNIAEGLDKEFNAEMLYGAAYDDRIVIQMKGSPFAWAAFLLWLPAILSLIGITMVGISVWQGIASIPSWVWATLAVGVGLLLFGPKIVKLVRGD